MQEFEIHGIKLGFTDGVMNYAKQHNIYLDLTSNSICQFEELYKKYGSADAMINKVTEDCGNLLREHIDIYIGKVVSAGCYDIDSELFLTNYLSKINSYFNVFEAYENIADQYNEIGKSQEEIRVYRELRKQSRSKFVGGGFGMSGAIKGAMGAGALNAVTGMGHSAVNLIGNIGTGIATSRQKRKLYENDETKKALVIGLQKDMFNIFLASLLMLEERCGIVFEIRSPENTKKVSAIVENIWDLELEDEKKTKVIREMFNLDPYNHDLYEYVFKEYGDEDFKLEEIADFFGVDLDYLKRDTLEQVIANAAKDTHTDYQKLLGAMDECIHKNGIAQEIYQAVYEQIQKKHDELYNAASTDSVK